MKREASPLSESSTWQQEEVFADASLYFASLLQGIESATRTIDLDFYIFEYDHLGEEVVTALIRAARRGVAVRLIIDGIGSAEDAHEIATRLSTAGIEVRIYHPHPFYPWVYRWSTVQGGLVQKFIRFFFFVNHRDHHKLCLIDGTWIWTGSFNISAKHLPVKEGGEGWHDYGVKLTDNTRSLLHGFDALWGTPHPRRLPPLQKIRSNLSDRLRQISNRILVRRIREARQRIWICHAYFAPTRNVLKAIRNARKNNVDVRIILPAISDIYFFPLLSRTYYAQLLRQGVRIYEYQPCILHAKLILVDSHCMIGSANMNHRSYYHDLEIDIVLSRPESIHEIEHCLLEDIMVSKEIHLTDLNKNSLLLFAARFLRIFKYWL